MDALTLGYIIIIILVSLYLLILILTYWYQNPKLNNTNTTNNNNNTNMSTVTYTSFGKRGDMGNQIFQLACIIAAGKRSKAKIVLPEQIKTLPLSQLFTFDSFEILNVKPEGIYREYDNYEDITIPSDGKVYDIRGYRQAYKYFEDHSEEIRRIFTPNKSILDRMKEVLPKKYIAVHIRKGDYIKTIHKIPLLREFRRCQLEYYKKGIIKLKEFYPDYPVLICTDSPKWVKPLLSELDSAAILAPIPKDLDPKFSDFCTLYLSDGVVISNSTYSFWAAYLRKDHQVIAPSPWWDPSGFIGTGMGLNGPYLQYPDWWLLDTDTGKILYEPHRNNTLDTNSDTLNLYKLIRGLIL